MKVAVLLTCFNRKLKTKARLQKLVAYKTPENISIQVVICDDRSTDGTAKILIEEFLGVNVAQGIGKSILGRGNA
jgi:glycosyltransferase involved in cell wall biosynthesis